MNIRRFARIEGNVCSYTQGEGRIGVLVEAEGSLADADAYEAARDAAMQIAAINPLYLSKDVVPAEDVEKEKHIIMAQIKEDPKNANKPDAIIEKMVDGIIKSGTDSVAVITHGGVIATILSNFGIPEGTVSQWLTPSCCGYTLLVSHFLWMSGKKVEVIKEIPENPDESSGGNYYDGWDYYPNDDDFDISEYLDDFND
jgi:hypothetical protein